MRDVETVGGKNASLGEMIGSLATAGVQVPGGFATTAHAYREFLEQGGLEARIRDELTKLDVDDVERLARNNPTIHKYMKISRVVPGVLLALALSATTLRAV